MKAELHSLNWPGSDPRLAGEQSAVFQHLQVPLKQHQLKADHSSWMDAVLLQSKADVVLFVDNVDLFATVCQQIRSGTFSTADYQSCIS